jgi:hypothetical protein
MQRKLLALSLLASAALLIGCAHTHSHGHSHANAGLLNARCPMQPACNQKLATTTDFQGGKVGFCCGGCLAEWNTLNDAQRAERLAAVKK